MLIKRLLGWSCCGEWSKWETFKKDFERPHNDMVDRIVAGTPMRVFTRRWQERFCTKCGFIQQRNLDQ